MTFFNRAYNALCKHDVHATIPTFGNPNPPAWVCTGCDWSGRTRNDAMAHLANEVDKVFDG